MNSPSPLPDEIVTAWRRGLTLPASALERYPMPVQPVSGDRGCNVLVDLAHHCRFELMWRLSGLLKENGYRCCSSHASIDTVLSPGTLSRVRTYAGTAEDGKPVRPLVWWPNPEFNVVLTFQADADAPVYTPEECDALETFVRGGGGLIVVTGCYGNGRFPSRGQYDEWPVRALLKRFGVDVAEDTDTVSGDTVPTFSAAADAWSTLARGDGGRPVAMARSCGAGQVLTVASLCLLLHPLWTGSDEDETRGRERLAFLLGVLEQAACGRAPVGGEPCIPDVYGGGGSIYPECETHVGSIVVFYARNQSPAVLSVVEEEFPRIQDQIQAWLPSPLPEECLILLLCAGNGGGWAVNAYYPKENGIISMDRHGLIGIFAHEYAHICSGPRNADGAVAGNWFDGNQGEAHAGFFQGRIWAQADGGGEMRDCNRIAEHEAAHGPVDIGALVADGYTGDKGWVWKKLWYIWQKLDDQYGTTWYPRWRWVQHTRRRDTPDRQLTLEDMIEDMSIACGEDLFPFIRRLGTTLSRDRLPAAEFDGEILELPVADIADGPAGHARFEPIGDYTKPLTSGGQTPATPT